MSLPGLYGVVLLRASATRMRLRGGPLGPASAGLRRGCHDRSESPPATRRRRLGFFHMEEATAAVAGCGIRMGPPRAHSCGGFAYKHAAVPLVTSSMGPGGPVPRSIRLRILYDSRVAPRSITRRVSLGIGGPSPLEKHAFRYLHRILQLTCEHGAGHAALRYPCSILPCGSSA